jgi:uncharacterized protein
MASRIDAYLVVGGKFHDFDRVRLELLKLLAEHPEVRVKVASDYEDLVGITSSSFLVSYTCDVRPSHEAQTAIRDWVIRGGRWMALHGTNCALDIPGNGIGFRAPRVFPLWTNTLGSQFISHPPVAPYPVEVVEPDHWLVNGIGDFTSGADELYLSEYQERGKLTPLLITRFRGEGRGFEEWDWSEGPEEHLVMYLRDLGRGTVLYNTLGHCRGHHDMGPTLAIDYYPVIEDGSWAVPQYYELLRRSIRWAKGETA